MVLTSAEKGWWTYWTEDVRQEEKRKTRENFMDELKENMQRAGVVEEVRFR